MQNKHFVSRAGEKLAFAVTAFQIPIANLICADFGSSVGGFVDCLIQNNAQKVYAIDTGYGELAWKLRNNPKVVVMERINAMHVFLPEKVDLITNDTSWTRQRNILPSILRNLKTNGLIITLIKPHYEAEKYLLKKGALPEETAEMVAKQTIREIESLNLRVKGFIKSPLTGSKGGNSEYLAYITNA